MHAVILESLEDFLAGTLEPVEHKAIEAHLSGCETCSREIRSMQDVSALFGSLRTETPVEASPGFYAQVMLDLNTRTPRSWFSLLDIAFARQLAFASLLTLAVLGTYLVSRESSYAGGYSPNAVMAQQNLPDFDSASPDNMLVTLTNYER